MTGATDRREFSSVEEIRAFYNLEDFLLESETPGLDGREAGQLVARRLLAAFSDKARRDLRAENRSAAPEAEKSKKRRSRRHEGT